MLKNYVNGEWRDEAGIAPLCRNQHDIHDIYVAIAVEVVLGDIRRFSAPPVVGHMHYVADIHGAILIVIYIARFYRCHGTRWNTGTRNGGRAG